VTHRHPDQRIVPLQLLFTLAATCLVYFLVPRGISLGTVAISSQEMSWNATSGTYNLVLQAEVPIFNPNYLQVSPGLQLRSMRQHMHTRG
jgi:hypothetical protein